MTAFAAHAAGGRERGSAAIIIAILLPLLIGVIGFALDINRIRSRKIELQTTADAMALAAAAELNGTPDGLDSATRAAVKVANDSSFGYQTTSRFLFFETNPVSFGASPAMDPASSPGSAGFARIDMYDPTGDTNPSRLSNTLSRIIGAPAETEYHVTAVAGRVETNVLPLAVCTLNDVPEGSHANYSGVPADKTEYGFRRGVSYNLLDQSPTTTARVFLVNPLDAPPAASQSKHFGADYVGPFMCAGSMAVGNVHAGSNLHVEEIDPAAWGAQLATWLNSRFEVYSGANACNRNGAPPDTNVQEYTGGYSKWYMKVSPVNASSKTVARNGSSRESVASLVSGDTTPDTVTEAAFGPLWTYSAPVRASGSGAYNVNQWPNMYKFGAVAVQAGISLNYPSSGTPYTKHTVVPTGGPGVSERRVLNVPLLDCAGWSGSGPAPVKAIGKFFMPAKASSTTIPAEFAGLIQAGKPSGTAVLFK